MPRIEKRFLHAAYTVCIMMIAIPAIALDYLSRFFIVMSKMVGRVSILINSVASGMKKDLDAMVAEYKEREIM
jgi:hypothetical protein